MKYCLTNHKKSSLHKLFLKSLRYRLCSMHFHLLFRIITIRLVAAHHSINEKAYDETFGMNYVML